LLLPWRNRVWLQYVSHKLGRLIVPYAMLAIFVASTVLAGHAFYAAVLACQVLFFLLAGAGAILEFVDQRSALPAPVPAASAPARPAAIRESA
jgi:hypothetical protein